MGCEAIDRLTMFNMDYQTNYTVPASTVINLPIDILTPDITTNSTSTFQQNDTRADLVESIKLNSLTLTLENPEDSNFNFLKELRIFLSADGLQEIEIAFVTDNPNSGTKTLQLETTGAELREYIKKPEFQLRVQTITDQAISRNHDIRIDCRFRVDAEVLGV